MARATVKELRDATRIEKAGRPHKNVELTFTISLSQSQLHKLRGIHLTPTDSVHKGTYKTATLDRLMWDENPNLGLQVAERVGRIEQILAWVVEAISLEDRRLMADS